MQPESHLHRGMVYAEQGLTGGRWSAFSQGLGPGRQLPRRQERGGIWDLVVSNLFVL